MPEPCLSKPPGKYERAAAFFALQSWSAACTAATDRIFQKNASLQILRPESAGFQQNLAGVAAAGKFASLSTKKPFWTCRSLVCRNPRESVRGLRPFLRCNRGRRRVRRPRNGFFEKNASLQILRPESAGFQQNLDREAAAGKFASLSTSLSKSLFDKLKLRQHAGASMQQKDGFP